MRKSLKLILPVPPSVNKYLYGKVIRLGNKTVARLAETQESKAYKFQITPMIKKQIKIQEWEMLEDGSMINVKIDFFFQRKGMDANNFLKIPFDVFTEVGVWKDDQFSKPQTGLVVIDKFNPRIEVTISKDSQHGVFLDEFDRVEFIEKYGDVLPKRSWQSLLKKLDEGRITENTYYDENKKVKMKKEE